MKNINYDEYQKISRQTSGCDELPILALGLVGETFEFISAYRHIESKGISVPLNEAIELVTEEAGDVLWYAARILDVLDTPFACWYHNGTTDNFNTCCIKERRIFRLLSNATTATEHIKKVFGHGHTLDKSCVITAVADIVRDVSYILKTLHGKSGFEIAMQKNITKLSARYPSGFEQEKSKNRQSQNAQI